MRALHNIEVEWILRPFRRLRIDRSSARLWSIMLTVLIVFAITIALGTMVLAKICSLIFIFVAVDVNAHNESVAHDRALVFLGMGLLAVVILASALLERDRILFYARAAGMTSKPSMERFWLLVLSAILPILCALAFYLYGPQFIAP